MRSSQLKWIENGRYGMAGKVNMALVDNRDTSIGLKRYQGWYYEMWGLGVGGAEKGKAHSQLDAQQKAQKAWDRWLKAAGLEPIERDETP